MRIRFRAQLMTSIARGQAKTSATTLVPLVAVRMRDPSMFLVKQSMPDPSATSTQNVTCMAVVMAIT